MEAFCRFATLFIRIDGADARLYQPGGHQHRGKDCNVFHSDYRSLAVDSGDRGHVWKRLDCLSGFGIELSSPLVVDSDIALGSYSRWSVLREFTTIPQTGKEVRAMAWLPRLGFT